LSASETHQFLAQQGDGFRFAQPILRTTNFEELKRDPDFLEDSVDAVVTIVTPQPLPAEAQAS